MTVAIKECVEKCVGNRTFKKIIEGALFAAGQPMNLEQLGFLFEEDERPDNASLRATLEALVADYEGRGIELKEVASGFRFQVRQETGYG